MPWGAVVGGALSLFGASQSAGASSQAAQDQEQAQEYAAQIQAQEFGIIQQEYEPQRTLGYGAMGELGQLYGFGNPNFNGGMYPANQATSQGLGQLGGGSFGGFGSQFSSGGFGNFTGGGTNAYSYGAPGSAFGIGTPNVFSPSTSAKVNPRGAAAPGATPGQAGTAYGPTGGQGQAYGAGNPNYAGFYNSPGYQFTLGTGEQAINRSAAAQGNLYAPNTAAALNNYAQGQASTQYNNYVQQLFSMAGLGGQATAGTAQAAYNTGANISQAASNAGNANASGVLGSASAWQSAINNATGPNGVFGSSGGNYQGTSPFMSNLMYQTDPSMND